MSKKDQQAMEADITVIQGAYHAYGVPEELQDFIWNTVAAFCLYQAANRQGPFHDALVAAGVTIAESPTAKSRTRAKSAPKPAAKRGGSR